MTLILTTNKEPREEVVRNVHAVGDAAGIEVIIFSGSALAHYLDYDEKGQWIRSSFLEIEQEHLSDELLHGLSLYSLKNSILHDDSELWIDRQLDKTLECDACHEVNFIVGESGLGKSVACHKHLTAHIETGGYGLIIPHQIIAESTSIEIAIATTLQQLHPSLVPGVGSEALSMASEHTRLLMVVEDINKSEQPASLIERLASWSCRHKDPKQAANWQILCPVWPRIFMALSNQARNRINDLVLTASPFTVCEGTTAVQHRREHAGIPVTHLDAESVASALGHDPLLIALQDPALKPEPDKVIQGFIDGSLGRLTEYRNEFTAGEYRQGLRQFAARMLELRCLDLAMTDVNSWFINKPNTTKMIRQIVLFGEIISRLGTASDERLTFRHDRVRDWLLVDAASDFMRREPMPENVLIEPFFAEIIGAALTCDDIPLSAVEKIRIANPLALFCAMRVFGTPTNNQHHAILNAADVWLADKAAHGPENESLRWTILRVLSEIDASYVIPLSHRFPKEYGNWWILRARFRNGDLISGVKLCGLHKPGIQFAGHLELIEHVQILHGRSLFSGLNDLLSSGRLSPATRSGALRLAGYLGDSTLTIAIKASWFIDTTREDRLDDYLWASAQCCCDHPASMLALVCDCWAALSNQTENEHSASPRDSLASHEIRWAFRDRLPETAIRYFIERAEGDDLRWAITIMLHGVDHPDAVDFVVREIAALDDRLVTTGDTSVFAKTAPEEWRRRQERNIGCPMSDASRNRLRDLWKNKRNRKHLRERAFDLWRVTVGKGDIPVLKAATNDNFLSNSVLIERLRRGDCEAKPELIQKLGKDEQGYWWREGRNIWSDELTECLDNALTQRRGRLGQAWDLSDNTLLDQALSEILIELPAETSEELLLNHWEYLRFSPYYFQAALYTATSHLRDLTAQVIAECPNPKIMFKRISLNFGINFYGRKGVSRIDQIEVLLPYLDNLEDSDILSFWHVCNRLRCFEFRRQHLDTRLMPEYQSAFMDDNRAQAVLDNQLAKGQPFWTYHWIENFFETADSIDHILDVLHNWLIRQTDVSALVMAADIVIHAGKRCHLPILQSQNLATEDQTTPIIANACFQLKRRSLT